MLRIFQSRGSGDAHAIAGVGRVPGVVAMGIDFGACIEPCMIWET